MRMSEGALAACGKRSDARNEGGLGRESINEGRRGDATVEPESCVVGRQPRQLARDANE